MARNWWIIFFLFSCSYVGGPSNSFFKQDILEKVAFDLAKENRELKKRIVILESELKKNQPGKQVAKRSVSSEGAIEYQTIDESWNPEDILFVAEIEYEREDFQKSSHFFNELLKKHPNFKRIDADLLYHAAISNFETGKNYSHTLEIFQKLISDFPNSKYFLESKLWISLIQFKLGDMQKSKKGLMEFKEKYQNTPEWKILEKNYEKIIKK